MKFEFTTNEPRRDSSLPGGWDFRGNHTHIINVTAKEQERSHASTYIGTAREKLRRKLEKELGHPVSTALRYEISHRRIDK